MLVTVIAGQACSVGQTCDRPERSGFRIVRDVCQLSKFDDVIAHGKVVEVGTTHDRLFSLWPSTRIAVTPVTIEVDRSVRGSVGRIDALVSLPVGIDGRLQRTDGPALSLGWFEGSLVDGELFVSCDGFRPEGPGGTIELVGTDPPSFSSADDLSKQLRAVEPECARRALTP